MPPERAHRPGHAPATRPVVPLVHRLLGDGAQHLSDAELLAVLLRGGSNATPALAAACRLLEAHNGSLRSITTGGLPPLSNPPDTHLAAAQTRRRALLQAALEFSRRSLLESLRERVLIGSPAELRDFLALWLRERPRECFAVLFLDSQNRLICAEEMFQGGIAQTAVYPREIARRALETGACSVIVAHNHPSGVSEPSASDRSLTHALRAALGVLDLPILDHFIIAGNRCYSFAEAGLL